MSDKPIYFPQYETKGGVPSIADTYAKVMDLFRQLEEQCYMLGHLHKANDNELVGQGFLAVGEMMKMSQVNVINLATGKLRRQGGFK